MLQRRWRASSTSRGIHRTKFPFESIRVARAAAVPLCFIPHTHPNRDGLQVWFRLDKQDKVMRESSNRRPFQSASCVLDALDGEGLRRLP